MDNTTTLPERNAAVVLDQRSSLYGRILKIVKQDAEYVYTEVKDGVNWIEAKFEHSQVALAAVPPAPIPSAHIPTVLNPIPVTDGTSSPS